MLELLSQRRLFFLPLIHYAIVASVTLFLHDISIYLIPFLLLLLPVLDKGWVIPAFMAYRKELTSLWVILLCFTVLLVFNPDYFETILLILIYTALPEEWFFRSYFMPWLEILTKGKWKANVVTSILFATLHLPMQGVQGLTVFIPSLLFGWLYQRNRNLVLVILLHALFNGVFIIYLKDLLLVF